MTIADHTSNSAFETFSLVLYVDGRHAQSERTERNLRAVLAEELPNQFALEVVDVAEHPDRANAAGVSITPALHYAAPDGVRELVGIVARRDQIMWLLNLEAETAAAAPNDTLSEVCPDGLALVNAAGRILSANPAARQLLDLTGEPHVEDIFGFPLSDPGPASLTLKDGTPIELRVFNTTAKGQPAHLAMIRELSSTDAAPTPDRQNEAPQSALQQAAQATDVARENMAYVERTSQEFSTFLRRASHDIKAPALSIETLLSTFPEDEQMALSEDGQDILQSIEKLANRLGELAVSIREFSFATQTRTPQAPTDLNEIMRWVLHDTKTQTRAARAIVDVSDLPVLIGSATQFYQVFLNMISNALTYREDHQILEIDVSAKRIQGTESGAEWRIDVADNGAGFDMASSEKIFEPFERLVAYHESPGTGIGLTTVRRIVHSLGGHVSAAPRPGGGSIFTLVFPDHGRAL